MLPVLVAPRNPMQTIISPPRPGIDRSIPHTTLNQHLYQFITSPAFLSKVCEGMQLDSDKLGWSVGSYRLIRSVK